jgi:hypothetical protein
VEDEVEEETRVEEVFSMMFLPTLVLELLSCSLEFNFLPD